MIRRAAPALLAAAALAACELPGAALSADRDARALGPPGTSPAALAALPAGVTPAFLIRDAEGCYGIAIERTDPPRGVPLLDAANRPICDA